MRPTLAVLSATAFSAVALAAPASSAPAPVVDPTVSPQRDTEAVILKGRAFAGWSAPSNQTVKLPLMDLAGPESCQVEVGAPDAGNVDPGSYDPTEGGVGIPDPTGPTAGAVTYDPEKCPAQDYAKPEVDTGKAAGEGAPIDRLLGYRWDAAKNEFVQIPLQVDEVFTRYLDNSRSGFAVYSGQDQHTTYAYDREGFRWSENEPDDPCQAKPRSDVARDPVGGLDTNDEIAFMNSDAGPAAPAGASLPEGIEEARQVVVADPLSGKADKTARFVYVMKAAADGPAPAFTAENGYVRYQRDANADRFAFSESSYDSYGNATKGPYCDPETGELVRNADGTPKIGQRRPLDGATIETDRYRFRYDGRWLLTKIQISPTDTRGEYGPDLVDRWKARAFAQDPSSETPCCGYEEEDTNWGGSSILLGERVGPVRAIRETWGADSGTNVVRRETFYEAEMRQKTFLRVHVIPPLDGIYAQWDFNAGRVSRFFNPHTASAANPKTQGKGVPIDGKNDEAFGNLDDPCNSNYDANDTGEFTQGYRQLYKQIAIGKYSMCDPFPYHLSMDFNDPTFSDANAALGWSMVTGANGTIVDRTSADVEDVSPGGTVQSLMAVPYYRDDACFDDGTGSDPGIEKFPRNPRKERQDGEANGRVCWDADNPDHPEVPGGDERFWQGSIGTHGLHILMVADSDNARQTVPLTEITAETRMVMLPSDRELGGEVGEAYGRSFEKPVATAVGPYVAGEGGSAKTKKQKKDKKDKGPKG